MRKIYKLLIISLALTLWICNAVGAYDFWYLNSKYSIDDSLKRKIDYFISKKITTRASTKKYLRALNKIDTSWLDDRRKWIIYYFISALDPTKATVINVNSFNLSNSWQTIPASALDTSITKNYRYTVNTPVSPIVENIPNTKREDTTESLDQVKKSYIRNIRSYAKEYAEVNDNMEFTEYSKTYKVKFKQYYDIDFNNPSEAYIQTWNIREEILLKKWNTFIITTWGYEIEQKLSINDLIEKTKFSSQNTEPVLFDIKDSYFYAYSLYSYRYYTIDKQGVYKSQFDWLWDIWKSILLYKNWSYLLVTIFDNIKLFPTSYLENSPNPMWVLSAIWKDLYYYKDTDVEKQMWDIKTKTSEIISWANSQDEKIKKIYAYVTSSISYDSYTLDYLAWKFNEKTYLNNVNDKVFSWLWAFKDKNAVCDWYTKLLLYMFEYAWVKDVKIETWKADVWWWKIVPHAWMRIWNLLYDPTWDIYAKWNESKYKWFWLSDQEFYKSHTYIKE